MESVLLPSWMFFLQLRHLTHRLFCAPLIPCSSPFACPLVVSRPSFATLSPYGTSFLPLWSLALQCLLFSVLSVKVLLMTTYGLTWVLVIVFFIIKLCFFFFSFFLSFGRSFFFPSVCWGESPDEHPGCWTILIKQIVSIIKNQYLQFLDFYRGA